MSLESDVVDDVLLLVCGEEVSLESDELEDVLLLLSEEYGSLVNEESEENELDEEPSLGQNSSVTRTTWVVPFTDAAATEKYGEIWVPYQR